MKKIILTAALCCATASLLHAQTGSIDSVLKSIEQHNKELKAGAEEVKAGKLDLKAENNPGDLSASYTRKFATQGGEPEIEFDVTQGFDFPTLYAQRKAYSRLQGRTLDMQQAVLRRDILLRAKELCLDLIRLNQLNALLQQRLNNAQEINALYEKRYKTGDANILEWNKVKLELMNMRTACAENQAAHRTALQELLALNGNMPLEFADTLYPTLPALKSYDEVRDEVMGSDWQLRTAQAGTEAARKLVTVNRHGWLPKLEAGYAREGSHVTMTNGFIVGVSLPLLSNRHKVKAAKARQMSAELKQEQTALQVDAQTQTLYHEAQRLDESIRTYDAALMENTLQALAKAVKAGQLSVLTYYTEAEAIYTNQEKLIDLENRYQKVMAQLYKNSL